MYDLVACSSMNPDVNAKHYPDRVARRRSSDAKIDFGQTKQTRRVEGSEMIQVAP